MRPFFILFVGAMLTACGSAERAANNAADTRPSASAAAMPTPAKAAETSQTVTIDSPDGVKLVGSYYETGKPMTPALLLLHQWQSDRHSYDEFAKKMQAAGFNVLAIDGRGFGESTKKADGTVVTPGRTDTDVKAMLGDVGSAFDFLAQNKNVDPKRIGIIGASYGSSLALIFAADRPDVAAVALLSPGLNYFGNLPTEPAIKKYGGRPLYLLSGQEKDKESFESIKKLNPTDGSKLRYEQTIHPDGDHGTALLSVGASEELRDFFSKHLLSK